MDQKRWVQLMESDDLKLTEEELALGWHFCWDWDGLLVGPEMKMEWDCCTCHPMKQEKPSGYAPYSSYKNLDGF